MHLFRLLWRRVSLVYSFKNTSIRLELKFRVTHLIGLVLSKHFPEYCSLFGFRVAKAVYFILLLCESITLDNFPIFPHHRLNFVADNFSCELVQIENCHKIITIKSLIAPRFSTAPRILASSPPWATILILKTTDAWQATTFLTRNKENPSIPAPPIYWFRSANDLKVSKHSWQVSSWILLLEENWDQRSWSCSPVKP